MSEPTTAVEVIPDKPQPPSVGEYGPRPQLAKALGEAQKRCRAVEHDAKNQHHGYAYTSSEAIITEAKVALAESGLALLPVRQTIRGSELCREFLLLHTSGEWLPVQVEWPIVPDRGRPMDKATGAAATLSLAYLLRDMLLMPRVDHADEVAGRDDREHVPPPAKPQPKEPAPQPQKPAKEWSSLAIDQSKRLRDSFERQLADAPDLAAVDKVVAGMKASGEHLTDTDRRFLFEALSARIRKHSRERLEEAGDTATVQDAVREMIAREKLFTREDREALRADVQATYARVRAEPVPAANGAAREPGVDEE